MSLPDINDIRRQLVALFDEMIWSEEEIAAAQRRHPGSAERIWDSYTLLWATHPLMRSETVYRAHCRELLERAAHGEDTRPGTAVECCLTLAEISARTPLRTSAAGLYVRMRRLSGLPPTAPPHADQHHEALVDLDALEALEAPRIDEQEGRLRARLRQPWRVLPTAAEYSSPPQP